MELKSKKDVKGNISTMLDEFNTNSYVTYFVEVIMYRICDYVVGVIRESELELEQKYDLESELKDKQELAPVSEPELIVLANQGEVWRLTKNGPEFLGTK